jgi:hypothetical protein
MIQEQQPDIDQLCVNTLRTLSLDRVAPPAGAGEIPASPSPHR